MGLKEVGTGDTITDTKAQIAYEPLTFPDPVIAVAIEPKSTGESTKLQKALDRLQSEDPSFKVTEDQETGQMLIKGMGELHLEIIVDRLKGSLRLRQMSGLLKSLIERLSRLEVTSVILSTVKLVVTGNMQA